MVVFKGAKREVAALKQEFHIEQLLHRQQKGEMDTELTKIWVDSVLGSFSFNRRLLAWDSYECHMEDSITESLKSKKIDLVIVPGGSTKYIQAPDVSWNHILSVFQFHTPSTAYLMIACRSTTIIFPILSSWFSPVMLSKLKIVTVQWIKSRILNI